MNTTMTFEQKGNGVEPNIVFYGGAGAGKTTAAKYLVDNYQYRRLSISDTLKSVAVSIWGQDAATSRDKLQKLGMGVREIDPDAWLNAFLRNFNYSDEGRICPVVNDDCRFPNEYWKLKELGFYFVHVLSQEETRVDRLLRIRKLDDISQLNHESETQLIGLEATKAGIIDDFCVFNYGSQDEFYKNIDDVMCAIEEQT